jgi:hypothetical protein
MPDKNEKERRKKIIDDLGQKSKEDFEMSLPMSRDDFQKLFDFLDEKLTDDDCDNTLKLTGEFLLINNILNSDSILAWLNENGGGCDCEVLMNIEELFE